MAVPHHVHTMGASHSQRHNCIARHCMAFHSRSFVMGFTVYFQPDADTGLAGGGHVESEGRGGLTMMALEVTCRRHNIVLTSCVVLFHVEECSVSTIFS